MKRLVVIMLFCTGLIFAQDSRTVNLGDFHTLKTYRGLQVEMIESESPKVVIEGRKASEVTVKNNNGVLKISLNISNTFSADDVMVYLHYNSEVKVIDANEGSHIFSDTTIKQSKLEVNAQEAGHIKLKVDIDDLKVTTSTGGQIKLRGTADNQRVRANTGGIYKGEGLESTTADISGGTGGIANVTVSEKADASASTGAVITVKGDPQELSKSESLGGYVRD